MKKINILVVVLFTAVLSWIIPECYHIVTDKAVSYPVCLYSSIANKFCYFDFDDDGLIRKDVDGNVYTESQFDSLLPLVYSNQLYCEGKLPEKIHGIAIDMQTIRKESFTYRYRPDNYNRPSIKLFPLFESIPRRHELLMPDEFFRISDKMEFINAESNSVNQRKSELYTKKLLNAGFVFPARIIAGIPSARKMYDEGYFLVDNNHSVFHMKLVNGKLYLRNTNISKDLMTEYIEATDFPNRKFYGFLFDRDGQMYTISTDKYDLQKVEIPPIDMENNSVFIMGNLLYWNVNITYCDKKVTYAIDSNTKKLVDSMEKDALEKNTSYGKYIFPFSIKFTSLNDKYVEPRIKIGSPYVLFFNLLFVLLYFLICRINRIKLNVFSFIWIGITGILGVFPSLIYRYNS